MKCPNCSKKGYNSEMERQIHHVGDTEYEVIYYCRACGYEYEDQEASKVASDYAAIESIPVYLEDYIEVINDKEIKEKLLNDLEIWKYAVTKAEEKIANKLKQLGIDPDEVI